MVMRVSVDKSDPGFLMYADLLTDGYRVIVKLNGVEVKDIITADEKEGFVVLPRRSPEGRLVVYGDSYVYDRHKGDVKIILERVGDDRVLH